VELDNRAELEGTGWFTLLLFAVAGGVKVADVTLAGAGSGKSSGID
jgi:hypothetical protein